MIKIFNEDCIQTMQKSLEENSIDLVITSPPYNNSRIDDSQESLF